MTQYVGVIRKELSAVMTPQGPQMQQNIGGNNPVDMKPDQFGQIGVRNQRAHQEKNPQPVGTGNVLLYDAENNPTSRVPDAMATRAVEERARKRGGIGQKIGQGIGGAIGVMGGLVSLANAGAAGQDAISGGVNAYQTGQYLTQEAKPRLGNLVGTIGAHTALPVRVTREKTSDVAPMVASPTNTPAATPVAVAAPTAPLPTDKRKVLGVDNYEGAQKIQQEAMSMLGNPHYNAGAFSAVNTTDDQGRTVGVQGAGPAQNQYDPTAINPNQLNPITPAGTLRLTKPDGTAYQSPQQVAITKPTVAQPTTQQDPGKVIANELGTIQQSLPLPDPNEPTDAEKTIESSAQTGKTISDALKIKMLKAEISGRRAAYDYFTKMFIEVKP